MNIDKDNFTHKRNGSKASLMEISDNNNNNEIRFYTQKRNTSKSNVDNVKYTHTRNGSLTNIINKRYGTFNRPVKINDRGSSLPRNNLDSHLHKQSHSNLRMNQSNDILIQTRESSLLYNNNNNNSNISGNNTKEFAVPYSSHSKENLNYLYYYNKLSPSTSPRDNSQNTSPLMAYKNAKNENQLHSPNYYPKNSHYSPTSPSSVSPKYGHTRDNYYNLKDNNSSNSSKSNNTHFISTSKESVLNSALRNKKMIHWTINDVLVWLTENNLEQYKELFKKMKMDGKLLMKQNFESLMSIPHQDKLAIINLRNSVQHYEEKNNNYNNQQYTQNLQRQLHDNLIVSTKEVDYLKEEVYHNLTKSRSFESLLMNNKGSDKENTPTSENITYTLPRPPLRTPNGDDIEDINTNKMTLIRTTSLKKKKMLKDENLNQQPVITPRSSSRNIEKSKYRRKHNEHVYDNGKVKTPTSSGSKNTTPLKEKNFFFYFANSPNSAKESPYDMTSPSYIQSPMKSSETYDEKVENSSPLQGLNLIPSVKPMPKFIITISNQSHVYTLDVTNYKDEIKLWERIFTKFGIALSKENFENYSLLLVQNGQKGKIK